MTDGITQSCKDSEEGIRERKIKDNPTPSYKLHKRDGIDTSEEAAEVLNVSKMEQEVLDVIREYPDCISDQVLSHFESRRYSTITARYTALLEKGLIIDTGERRPGVSGRNQRVMKAVLE